MNEQIIQMLMSRFGGPQQFQNAMNTAQQRLSQCNMTIDQFMNNPQNAMSNLVNSGVISQDALNAAIQKANQTIPRR